MPLSTSTIVLGLATVSVFGYAVRDQVKNGKPSPFKELNEEYEYKRATEVSDEQIEERMREYEAERAKFRAEQEELERARAKARLEAIEAREAQLEKDKVRDVRELSKLFGTNRATFGGALAGTRIGMTSTELAPKLEAVNKVTEELHAGATLVDDTGDVLRSLTLLPRLGCNDLRDAVAALWGTGTPLGGRTVWLDDRASMRVVLEKSSDRSCSYLFEQYAPVDRWLNQTAASVVPVAFLGRSDIELITEVKRRKTAHSVTTNDATISWSDVGVGVGSGMTTFKATVTKGKVTGLEANIEADEALLTRIKAVFGKPVDEDVTPMTWTKPYYISWDGSTLTLSTQKPEE